MELTASKLKLLARGSNSQVYLYSKEDTGVVLKIVRCSCKQTKHLSNEYHILKAIPRPRIISTFIYSEHVSFQVSSCSESIRNVLVVGAGKCRSWKRAQPDKKQTPLDMLSSDLFHQLFPTIVYLYYLKFHNVLLTENSGKLMTKLAGLVFSESIVRGDKSIWLRRFMRTYIEVDYMMEGKLIYLRQLGIILFTMVCRKYPFEYITIKRPRMEEIWESETKSNEIIVQL